MCEMSTNAMYLLDVRPKLPRSQLCICFLPDKESRSLLAVVDYLALTDSRTTYQSSHVILLTDFRDVTDGACQLCVKGFEFVEIFNFCGLLERDAIHVQKRMLIFQILVAEIIMDQAICMHF